MTFPLHTPSPMCDEARHNTATVSTLKPLCRGRLYDRFQQKPRVMLRKCFCENMFKEGLWSRSFQNLSGRQTSRKKNCWPREGPSSQRHRWFPAGFQVKQSGIHYSTVSYNSKHRWQQPRSQPYLYYIILHNCVMWCYLVLCCVVSCYAMVCYVISYDYTMLYYIILYHIILHYDLPSRASRRRARMAGPRRGGGATAGGSGALILLLLLLLLLLRRPDITQEGPLV